MFHVSKGVFSLKLNCALVQSEHLLFATFAAGTGVADVFCFWGVPLGLRASGRVLSRALFAWPFGRRRRAPAATAPSRD
jgi:hypothetical protein